MLNESEQKAIEEKLEQLKKVKAGILTPQELADLITQRRVSWFEKNKDIALKKYDRLSDEEKAYKIIFLEHMKINPEHSKMIRVGNGKIKIESELTDMEIIVAASPSEIESVLEEWLATIR